MAARKAALVASSDDQADQAVGIDAGELKRLQTFAMGCYQRGGVPELYPPDIARLPPVEQERYRFKVGAVRVARELLAPEHEGHATDSDTLRWDLSTSILITDSVGISLGFASGIDADALAREIVDEAVRQNEQAALRSGGGSGELTAEAADAWPPLLVDYPLTQIQADQPQRIVDGLLTAKNTTLLSSQGGVGKSCLLMQAAIEITQGRPLWAVPELIPHGRRALYLNAEDDRRNINYWLAKILPAYGLQTCPFTIIPAKEAPGGNFVLSESTIAWLIEIINTGRYDALFIDTAISVMELPASGNAYIDPLAIRGWLRRSVGAIERHTDAAVALAVHDSKAGEAASGPADWRNFARLVLQLQQGEQDGLLKLTTIKGNLGFPYRELIVDRDPQTLTATFRTGTRIGRSQAGTVPRTADEITGVLTGLYNQHVRLLPADRRLKESVESILVTQAGDMKIARSKVRDFIRSAVRFEDRPGRGNPKLAVGLPSDSSEAAD